MTHDNSEDRELGLHTHSYSSGVAGFSLSIYPNSDCLLLHFPPSLHRSSLSVAILLPQLIFVLLIKRHTNRHCTGSLLLRSGSQLHQRCVWDSCGPGALPGPERQLVMFASKSAGCVKALHGRIISMQFLKCSLIQRSCICFYVNN